MSVTLARTIQRGVSTGDPLPDVYQSLARAQVRFRRSNLHMIAGAPGSMKTMFALDLVKRTDVPTLYFSNDSDEATVASRLLASRIGQPTNLVADWLTDSPEFAADYLREMEMVRWSFNPSPTLEDIQLEVEAFAEIYGEYPHLIVIDVLVNVSYYADTDHGSVGEILKYLHGMARETRAAVIVVHHCTEAVGGHPCPPRSAIMQKRNELPVLILSVAVQGEIFHVAPLKNRWGPQDPSGKTAIGMHVDPATCTFREF